jgi:hypothetical protein
MRHYVPEILAVIALILSVSALVYQHFASKGAWWDWPQFWHYEPFIAMGIVAAVALVVGKYLGKL